MDVGGWVEQARVLGRQDAEAGNSPKNDHELRNCLDASLSDYSQRQTLGYWWNLSDGQRFAEAYDDGFTSQAESP